MKRDPSLLRVATLNLWNKSGPWAERMKSVRAQLDALQPDILGLQEVLELRPKGGPAMNQCDELRPANWPDDNWHSVYGPSHDMSKSFMGGASAPKLWFGNSIVSRWPIRQHAVLPLPGDDVSDQTRTLLHAVVETPHGPVDVFVTHLNWKLDEGWVRETQVQEIARIIEERAPEDGRFPPLLMGDLNAEPQSDEIRYLNGHTRLGSPRSVRFTDMWAYRTDREDEGCTFDPVRNPFAAQYPEPPRRIDYLFVRGPHVSGPSARPRVIPGRPLKVGLCFDAEVPVFASDHFGVWADLATPE